jgi:hypothetical protein
VPGSQPHARILATSTRLPDEFQHAVEEVLFNHQGMGGREDHQVRGDTMLFTTPQEAPSSPLGRRDGAPPWRRPKLPGHRYTDEADLVTMSA